MTKIEHFESKMDARDWQLYDMELNEEVAWTLNWSLKVLSHQDIGQYQDNFNEWTIGNWISALKRVQQNMQRVLSVYAEFGAYDSEPDGMLAYQIQKMYEHYSGKTNLEVGRWGIRQEGEDKWI